jgi:predicted amidohydrolase
MPVAGSRPPATVAGSVRYVGAVRAPLALAVAQPPCVPFDVTANATAHADAVRAAGSRVVVFPELSLTGYELEADPVDPSGLEPIVAACAETGSVALVGAPVPSPDAPHIAMLAVSAAGAGVVYRKMWLGAEEAVRFSPGAEPAVLDVDGWRLGLAICKDTGVAEHAAATVALGVDAYVAGTVKSADESALQHERARRVAADHAVWVAIASFAGSTGGGFDRAAGRSGIWAPGGGVVAQAGPEVGEIVRATLH